MADKPEGETGRYAAFLSYSHKDAAAARRLHRRLEAYRLPSRLAGTEGERGTVPARLVPIFRDREELPAAGDLSERVRAALADSRSLILLCSPNAAASPWVAREIALFRELHPAAPIFAALVEGEPAEAFPAALSERGSEPLAADLRPEGDGPRLGFLKLVAGLSGVGLDDLVRRDAQRRLRRVTAVTVAAVAAMLVMAVLTALAFTARAEAERQRREAEGLVEFMLTDLRNKLRSVGRLEIMESVNARALKRYGKAEDLRALSPEALARRARILHAIGEDELTLGNLARAESVLKEAYRGTSAQLQRDPQNREVRLAHARSEYWLGRLHEERREWPQARRRYLRFAGAADSLLATDPANPDFLREVAWSRLDLGNVQLGLQDFGGAERFYSEASRLFTRLAKLRPDDNADRALANAFAWLADSYFLRADYRRSLAAREKQHAIMGALHRKRPADADLAYRYALAQRGLGKSLEMTGQRDRASAELIQANSTARTLVSKDPANNDWRLFAAMMDCDLLFGRTRPLPLSGKRLLQDFLHADAGALRAGGDARIETLHNCIAAAQDASGAEDSRGEG